jgi:hypothetical protein
MAQVKMEGIHLCFIIFMDSLAIIYNTLELGPLPRGGTRKKRISTPGQWHCKQNFYVGPLSNCSMVDERDLSIFYKLTGQFAHELHYFKVGITQKRQ